jgi:hypothetical protein
LIHGSLAIIGRDGPGDLGREYAGDGEMSRVNDRGIARRNNRNKRNAVVALFSAPGSG